MGTAQSNDDDLIDKLLQKVVSYSYLCGAIAFLLAIIAFALVNLAR